MIKKWYVKILTVSLFMAVALAALSVFVPASSFSVVHEALPTLAVLPTAAPMLAVAPAPLLAAPLASPNNPIARPELASLPFAPVPTDVPVSNRLIIEFAPNTSAAQRAAYLTQNGLTTVQTLDQLNSIVVIAASPDRPLPAEGVVSTQPDAFVRAQMTPNDPFYAQQWGLTALNIPPVWDSLPANTPPVTVAVIDSGVCPQHPDLVGRVLPGWNFVNGTSDVTDEFGHGCAVAGILAAQTNNALGMAGIAPNIQILPLKVLDAQGVGLYSDVAAAMVYAVDHGAQIINLSLGGTQPLTLLENAVAYAGQHGVQIVAAAGNGGSTTLLYPAAYPAVIAVGSLDANGQRSSFSSYGPGIDSQAPGRDIVAPTLTGGYARYSGTSFAAPFVSGALVLAQTIHQPLALAGQPIKFAAAVGVTPTPALDVTPTPPSAPALVDDDVRLALAQRGSVRVMIALNLPPSAQEEGADPAPMVALAQTNVLAQLAPTDFVLAQQYVTVPALAGTITGTSLAVLQSQPMVARIYLDEPVEQAAARSVIAIKADQVQTGAVSGLNLTGAGVNVAVIDSGVDMSNAAVSTSVVYQKCFSSEKHCPNNIPGQPPRTESEVAPDGTLHGTGIAGIITAPQGVAPGAGIVAIKVLDEFGRGYNSDWVKALDWVAQSQRDEIIKIDIVNMSLGTMKVYKPVAGSQVDSCDERLPAESEAIQAVLALGIPVFAATGNQGSSDSISAPACMSGVIGVGAVYDSPLGDEPDSGTYNSQLQGSWPACVDTNTKTDQVTCFTNSNRWLDVLAPGAQIIIGGVGGSGTSQATPHATGVAALMIEGYRRSSNPGKRFPSPSTINSILRATGPLISDPRNREVFRRLDALDAVNQLLNPVGFTGCNEVIGIPASQCRGLVALFAATSGPNWRDHSGWLQTNTPCTWYGVTCGVNTVTKLEGLNQAPGGGAVNQLSGSLPPEIGNLVDLQVLSLQLVSLSNPLPPQLWTLTKLQRLSLVSCHIHGPLPAEIGQLTNLTDLNISDSNLTGPIPPEIGQLTQLQFLSLAANQLTSVPSTVSQLTNLRTLWLSNNPLGGVLPNSLGTLPNLSNLQISNIGLRSLPSFIGSIPLLDFLDASGQYGFGETLNQATGTIPPSWSGLINLRTLNLKGNALSGPYPAVLAALPQIQIINLADNDFTGSLPASLFTDQVLELNLSGNDFSGELPSTLYQMGNLSLLNLSRNQLSGDLPVSPNPLVTYFPSLYTLDLSYNQFTGSIPSEMLPTYNFLGAQQLNLSNNHLTGAIPKEIYNIRDVNLSNNNLTDTQPTGQTLSSTSWTIDLSGNWLTSLPEIVSTGQPIRGFLEFNVNYNRIDPLTLTSINGVFFLGAETQLLPPTGVTVYEYGDHFELSWSSDNSPLDIWQIGYEIQTTVDSETSTTRLCCFTVPEDPMYILNVAKLPGKTYTFQVRRVVDSLTNSLNRDYYGAYSSQQAIVASGSDFCTANPAIATTTCQALVSFYQSTGGYAWSSNVNWLVTDNVCSWYGVVCSSSWPYPVTGLNLPWNNLTGTLPASLGDLTDLTTLDLSDNNLAGTLPASIGNLTALTSLNLRGFRFEGGLPTQLSNLTNLQSLILQNTNGYGPLGSLPLTIGNLSQLQVLNLAGHRLSGSIPASIGSLTQLQTLDLSTYRASLFKLSGQLPSELANLTALQVLNLDNNNFTGTIPSSLPSLPALQELRLASGGAGGFVGGLPTVWPSTSPLKIMSITGHYALGGSLPAQLGNLSQLTTLDLSGNNIPGMIPAQLGNLGQLTSLNLSENRLTGAIPPELGQLSLLETLNLRFNLLSGSIPVQLGNLGWFTANPQVLDLGYNQLSGPIPPELVTGLGLQWLTKLDLSHNNLTGVIPDVFSVVNLPAGMELYLSFNYLQGPLPALLYLPAPGFLDLRYNQISTSDAALIANLNTVQPDWRHGQMLPLTDVAVSDISLAGITLTWTPIQTDSFETGAYEVACADTENGVYTTVGRTTTLAASSLLLPHFRTGLLHYCKVDAVASYSFNGVTWSVTTAYSAPVTVIIPEAFAPQIPIDAVPSVFEIDVPEPDVPEHTDNACSEATGKAMSFRGSGRAMSFRGSGRALSFRGSGDAKILNANTNGSGFDTVLTVWRVPADEPFDEAHAQLITCNDNNAAPTGETGPEDGVERPPSSPSYTSAVSVPFDRNYDLYFVVYARNNEFGRLTFNITGVNTNITVIPPVQSLALTALYSSTNGSNWINHSGWFENDNPCAWYGVTCTGANVTGLSLTANRLDGKLPPELAALTALTTLNLGSNALSGPLPPELTALTALTTLNLDYNALFSTNAGLTSFLNSKSPTWQQTQTIAPTALAAGATTTSSLALSWTPILYTGDGGAYDVGCNQTAGGPYAFGQLTANKTTTNRTLTMLLPGTTYYCAARTLTPAHGAQLNALVSQISSEVTAATTLPLGLTGSGGQYTLSGSPFPFTFQADTRTLPLPVTGLPRPNCAALPGRAIGLRGQYSGRLALSTVGTLYGHSLSLWLIPTGAPLTSAIPINCQSSQTSAQFEAAIPPGYDYYVMVTGINGEGGLLTLRLNNVPNQPPTARADTYTLLMGSTLTLEAPGVLSNDSDAENGALQAVLVQTVQHGTLNLNSSGRFIYRPQTGYVGEDRFTYRACDPVNACTETEVALRIAPANGTPITLILPISTAADLINEDGASWGGERSSAWVGNLTSKTSSLLGVRFNDIFVPSGATITAARLEVYSPLAQTTPLKLLIAGEAADQSTAFTPASPPSGRSVTNARLQTPINTPWTVATWYSVGDVTAIVQEIVNRPGWQRGGSLSLLLKGIGNAREFRRLAGVGNTAPRLVIDMVYSAVNHAPTPDTEAVSTRQNTPIIISVLANDSDPDGDALHLDPSPLNAARGSVVNNGNNTVTYTPQANYLGLDGFNYTVCDLGNLCATISVSIRVTAVPGVPTTITIPIQSAADDVNEDGLGLTDNRSALLLGAMNEQSYSGLRFGDIPIPMGSQITAAQLQVYSPMTQTTSASVWIAGEAADQSLPFGSTHKLSSRTLTAHNQSLLMMSAWAAGSWQPLSTDLASILQEIINRPGWQENNALSLIVRSPAAAGQRWMSSLEGGHAAFLTITFIAPDLGALGLDLPIEALDTPTQETLLPPDVALSATPTALMPTAEASLTPTATLINPTPDATETPLPTEALPILPTMTETPLVSVSTETSLVQVTEDTPMEVMTDSPLQNP